jgi:uncharacterized protein
MDKRITIALLKYVRLIREKYADFETVYVFGSYASGNKNQDSDIDVALIFKDLDDSKRFDIQVQLMILASKIDNRIEPHPLSHEDFNSDNPFASEIKRTGYKLA